MPRKHIEWQNTGNGLCGKPIQANKPRDLTCNHCTDIAHVMRAVRVGANEVRLNLAHVPEGNNACRVECDTNSPEFRKFAALMRRGLELHGSGHVYTFSIRGKTDTGATVRPMAG